MLTLKCKPAKSKAEFDKQFTELSNADTLNDYYWFKCPAWDECCCARCAVSEFNKEDARCR